jgi:hypothetical protein
MTPATRSTLCAASLLLTACAGSPHTPEPAATPAIEVAEDQPADAAPLPPEDETAKVSIGRHLSADCDGAVYLDLEKLYRWPPIARRVAPLLEAAHEHPGNSDEPPRFQRFLADLKMSPTRAFQGVAMCAVKDPGEGKLRFAIVMAGELQPGVALASLRRHHNPKRALEEIRLGDRKALHAADKDLYVTEAADGVLIIAQGRELAALAIPRNDAAEPFFEFPTDSVISVVVTRRVVRKSLAKKPDGPFAAHAEAAGSATFTADLANGIVEGRLPMRDQAAAAELADFVTLVVAEIAKDTSRVEAAKKRLGFDVLEAIEISHEANDVVARVEVPQRNVDALIDIIVDGIEEKLR